MPISVLLADDHPVVRCGLQTVLEREPEFSIVGAATDGLEAVEMAEKLKPDVLVLDLMLPGLSGLEVLRILGERSPKTRTVILSMYRSNAFVAQALRSGAMGYVLKGCSEENLVRAVREAAAGGVSSVPRSRRSLSTLTSSNPRKAHSIRTKPSVRDSVRSCNWRRKGRPMR